MSTGRAKKITGQPIPQILKELFHSLNPVRALRIRISTGHSQGEIKGHGRCALQSSIVVLDIAFSAAETIPVFGPPLKGALEALFKVLKLIEVS